MDKEHKELARSAFLAIGLLMDRMGTKKETFTTTEIADYLGGVDVFFNPVDQTWVIRRTDV